MIADLVKISILVLLWKSFFLLFFKWRPPQLWPLLSSTYSPFIRCIHYTQPEWHYCGSVRKIFFITILMRLIKIFLWPAPVWSLRTAVCVRVQCPGCLTANILQTGTPRGTPRGTSPWTIQTTRDAAFGTTHVSFSLPVFDLFLYEYLSHFGNPFQ